MDFSPITARLDVIEDRTDTLGGVGAITWPYTLREPDGTPISDADVWVTTDDGGADVVASGRTDDFGAVIGDFFLDAGTYYVWAQKAGWDFANPDVEVVTP